MAVPRASSGMLRSQIRRPAAARAPLRSTQTRAQTRGRDDLGGPGGQEPPPQRPGGPDVLQRNWPAVGGVALVLVGAYAYFTGGGPGSKDKARAAADEVKAKGEEAKAKGEEGLRKLEGKDASNPMGEMSGRKSGMGGFRGE